MTLLLDNEDVRAVLTMDVTMRALDEAYTRLAAGGAVCRPRIDIRIPTDDAHKTYRWGTTEGGSAGGYFAIRMKSDIVFQQEHEGIRTEEKYCVRPGTFRGLILQFDMGNGEPLAIINDGYLQHMRAGAEPVEARRKRGRGAIAEDRSVLLAELLRDPAKGRTSPEQITFSERGNIQGAQFFAVAGKVYELAKARDLGKTIPTEWLLQDIRD